MPDALEERIEALVLDEAATPACAATGSARLAFQATAVSDYVDHSESTVPYSLDGHEGGCGLRQRLCQRHGAAFV